MNNEEWYYIIDKNNCVFQLFGNELRDIKSHVAVLEYIFNLKNSYDCLALKKRNGIEYYRAGIGHNTEELKQIGLGKYIRYFDKLNREVTCISDKDIARVITPNKALQDVTNGKILTEPHVKRDLMYLLNVLKYNISEDIIDYIGIEGSLCFGISHEFSDIDIIINGQKAFERINTDWKNIVNNERKISLLDNLPICQEDLVLDRKKFIPCLEEEILFHECRKNYAYIQKDRIYRKVNIVGKLNKNDILYKERENKYFSNRSFKPVGLCKIRGITQTDNLGNYIPSIYDTKTLNFHPITKNNPDFPVAADVSYIIDYVGSYYMQLKKGEIFESIGMLEEIYINDHPSGKYRISLNHWDGHIENGMYLKTIANNYDDYINGKVAYENNERKCKFSIVPHLLYKGR